MITLYKVFRFLVIIDQDHWLLCICRDFVWKFQGSAALIALCGGHSPSHHERCASAIGSLPKGCGFVLDLMQFAKRLRVLPKKRK